MTSPKIEFTTLADEPLSAKYRPADALMVFSLWAEQPCGSTNLSPDPPDEPTR